MNEHLAPDLREAIGMIRSGKSLAAISLLDHVIGRDPDSWIALLERARARMFCDDIEGAFADLAEMARRWPHNTKVFTLRAQVCERIEDWQRGIKDYTAAIAIDHQHEIAWFHRGRFKAFAGDLEGAIADFTESMKWSRRGPLSELLNRGKARHRAGDFEGALSDLNEAVRLDISQIHAPYLRGCIKLAAGDFGGAVADFSIALTSFPRFTNALRLRAQAKRKLGDVRGATDDLLEYRKLGGEDLPAYTWHSAGCEVDD